MSLTYYRDDQVTLLLGDALQVAAILPAGAADCIVTSPPYFGLRDYGTEGQYGLEASPAEYVETMRALFAELRRVLADDGTLWLNIGDSYSSAGPSGASYQSETTKRRDAGNGVDGVFRVSKRLKEQGLDYSRKKPKPTGGIPSKNLLGIPWRVAFALQDDGWILRNAIIWSKPNAMPESVTDRLSGRYEHVFMFSKSRRYWFDLDPIREAHSASSTYHQDIARRRPHNPGKAAASGHYKPGVDKSGFGAGMRELNPIGANPGDVWTIPTAPFSAAHFAVMPVQLAQRCILAGCPPRRCGECGHVPEPIVEKGGLVSSHNDSVTRNLVTQGNSGHVGTAASERDFAGGAQSLPRRERTTTGYTDCGHNAYRAGTVLDPFSGSGTTGLAAQRTGRKYVGIDLNAEYHDLALTHRLGQSALDFQEGA